MVTALDNTTIMSIHSVDNKVNPMDILFKLSNSTLIIPSVSIGNIPQLSLDLLIWNYKSFKKIARLDDCYLYPFISPGSGSGSGSGSIDTALEVYYNEELKLTILQQRSPILPGLTKTFINEIMLPFIKNCEFEKVIVLTSTEQQQQNSELFTVFTDDLNEIFKHKNKIGGGQDQNAGQGQGQAEGLDGVKFVETFTSLKPIYYIDQLINSITSQTTTTTTTATTTTSTITSHELTESPSEMSLYNTLKDKYPMSSAIAMARGGSNSANASNTSLSTAAVGSSTNSTKLMVISIQCYEGDNTQDAINLTKCLLSLLLNHHADQRTVASEFELERPKSWESFYGVKEVPIGIDGLYS